MPPFDLIHWDVASLIHLNCVSTKAFEMKRQLSIKQAGDGFFKCRPLNGFANQFGNRYNTYVVGSFNRGSGFDGIGDYQFLEFGRGDARNRAA